MTYKLKDVAAVIRSKNSGPYELTFDIIFSDVATFRRIVEAQVINEELITRLYRMERGRVLSIIPFPAALAIKVTVVRPIPSGSKGDRDIYGAQQHVPLMDVEIEL